MFLPIDLVILVLERYYKEMSFKKRKKSKKEKVI